MKHRGSLAISQAIIALESRYGFPVIVLVRETMKRTWSAARAFALSLTMKLPTYCIYSHHPSIVGTGVWLKNFFLPEPSELSTSPEKPTQSR